MRLLRPDFFQPPSFGLVLLLFIGLVATVSMSEEDAQENGEQEAKSSLVGDIDGSGAVDEKDGTLMEKAIGANPDDPDWDERCDLDGDRFVSFKDLSILKGNMGKRIIGGEILSGEGYYSCRLPKLFWAPSIQMGELPGNELCGVEIKLRLRVSEHGSTISVRPVLSEVSQAGTRALVALSRVWHFEPAQDASGAPVASYCIVTMNWSDLCEVPGGQLPE